MVTFSALINIILFSSISVAILSVVFKDNQVVLKLDIRFLLICMLAILFRLLIPIESPLTKDIPVSHIYPAIYIFLKEPFLSFENVDLSILVLLKYIWFAGFVYFFIKMICSYLSLKKLIYSFAESEGKQLIKVMELVKSEYGGSIRFKLVIDESVDTPIVFGLFNPCIVIPKMVFTDEELYFILRHEMLHYYRGDLLVKILCELLRAIYWWNPFISLLERLIANMQEINVDFTILRRLSNKKKLDYMACLLKVAKERETKKNNNYWMVAFQKESSSGVYKRISLMLENMDINKQKTVASIMLSALILGLVVFCPNILIFEPYSISAEDAEGTFDLEKDNVFYLKNQDDSFSLFWDGQYVATVTEMLGEDIQVYNSLEEVERNE